MSPGIRVRLAGPNSHYDKGMDYIQAKNYRAAIEELKQSLIISPNHAGTYGALGSCYATIQQYSEALNHFKKAIDLEPQNTNIIFNLALTLKKLNQYDQALYYLDKLSELAPNDENAYIIKGNILSDRNLKQDALECYDIALTLNPNSSLARQNKITLLKEIGKESEAKKVEQEGAILDKDDDHTFTLKGINAYKEGKYEEAFNYFNRALEINPNDEKLLNYQQSVQIKLGSISKSTNNTKICQNCNSVCKSQDKFCGICGNKLETFEQDEGNKCINCGKLNKKESNFCINCGQKLTKIPSRESDLDELKVNVEDFNFYDDTIDKVQKSLMFFSILKQLIRKITDENKQRDILNLFNDKYKSNDRYRQIEFLEELKKHIPDEKIVWLLLVTYHMEVKNLGQAAVYAKKVIKLNPNDDIMFNKLGWMYIMLAKFDDAFDCFYQALELNPNNLSIYKNLSLVHEVIGNKEKAIEFLKKYLSKYPDDSEAHQRLNDLIDNTSKILDIRDKIKDTLAYGYYLDYSNMETPEKDGIKSVKMVPIIDEDLYQDIEVKEEELVEFRGEKILIEEVNFLKEIEDLTEKNFEVSEATYIGQNLSITIIKNRVINLGINDVNLTYIPDSIGNLTALRKFSISKTQIQSLPDNIENLTKLEDFHVTFNKNLFKLPETIGNLKNVIKFYCGHNHLIELPETIGELSSVEIINIPLNKIERIPDTIGNLKNLKHVDFQGNQLKLLPDSIGNLDFLETICLFNNKIEKLPNSIGNLLTLKHLWVDKNQLETLPLTIDNLKKLEWLKLIENPITNLPDCLVNLPSLEKIDFYDQEFYDGLDSTSKEVVIELWDKGVKFDDIMKRPNISF